MHVDAISVRGEWIRHAPHHAPLLSRSHVPTDGRWQRATTVRGLYVADEPDTAIAEWYRRLAELGLPPQHSIPHDHHIWTINLQLADLSTSKRLAALGLSPPQPSRRAWPRFQQAGEQLWRDGWPGLLAPSAARPGSLIACLFDADSWPPPGCQPVRAIEIITVPAPPTGMTT